MSEVSKKKEVTVSLLILALVPILWRKSLAHKESDETFFLRDILNVTIHDFKDSQSKKEAIINNLGCRIPYVGTLPHSLWNSYRYPEILKPCHFIHYPLLKSNQSHVWVLDENLSHYGVKKSVEFECCYQELRYLLNNNILNRDKERYSKSQCKYFQRYIEADDESIRVTCKYDLKVIYEQFFAFVIKKPFTPHRFKSFNALQTHYAYNVIILGLSSISRANFHRTMRHTSKFLAEKGAVELFGYNKVANSTFFNLMAVLTGMDEKQLKETCWPNASITIDGCSFIWERFKDQGYYSAFLEDSNEYGIFKNNNFGFSGTPTDYYFYPFESGAKNNVCFGNEYIYSAELNHLKEITSATTSSKLFALFWESSISHEYLNLPMVMDLKYKTFLQTIESSGYLDETILIVLSDRGLKFSNKLLNKKFGLEANLPIASILVPPSFRTKYTTAFKNLQINSHRLTTPFDIHATLIDLINLHAVKNQEIATRTTMGYKKRRGISLFLPISEKRTCRLAGIEKHWCSCRINKKIKKHKKSKIR